MSPTWESKCGTVKLWLCDCLSVDPFHDCVFITDPVWPTCPEGLLHGQNETWEITSQALKLSMPKTIVLCLGFDCDPRWLSCVPTEYPFIRSMQMPYAVPGYRGRLLGGDEVAYCFGELPTYHQGLIPGRLKTETSTKQSRENGHPCPRSLVHMSDLVKHWSNEGDTVVDVFMGSGTTGVASVRLGRAFCGVEIDSEYFEIAKRRIEIELDRVAFLETEQKPEHAERWLFE